MNDPLRLRDDPTAPSPLRADLRRAAAARAPVDVDAGLARLLAATAAGAATAAAAQAAAAPAGSGAGSGIVLAAAKGAVLGLLAVGVVSVATAVMDAAPPPAPSAQVAPPTSPRAPLLAPSAPEPTASASTTASAAPAPPASVARPSRRLLAEEVQHLGELRERLDASPDDVLAEAERGGRAFPGGALGQEREALAIEALVRLGRKAEARARAAEFAARYPRSPLLPKVRGLVGE